MATRERMPGKTANKYFDVAFFILQRSEMLASVTRHFAGAAIWRAYGLDASVSYSGTWTSTKSGGGWEGHPPDG